jgi:hypothetical protein
MKRTTLSSVLLVSTLSLALVGCGSTPVKPAVPLAAAPSDTVSNVPDWFLKPTASTEDTVYVAGTAMSRDLGMVVHKAEMDAETHLASKIAGEISTMTKSYKRDNGDTVDESTEVVANKIAAEVKLAGASVVERKLFAEGGGYRAYVLVKFSVANYNRMLQMAANGRTFKADKTAAELELNARVAAKAAKAE